MKPVILGALLLFVTLTLVIPLKMVNDIKNPRTALQTKL